MAIVGREGGVEVGRVMGAMEMVGVWLPTSRPDSAGSAGAASVFGAGAHDPLGDGAGSGRAVGHELDEGRASDVRGHVDGGGVPLGREPGDRSAGIADGDAGIGEARGEPKPQPCRVTPVRNQGATAGRGDQQALVVVAGFSADEGRVGVGRELR